MNAIGGKRFGAAVVAFFCLMLASKGVCWAWSNTLLLEAGVAPKASEGVKLTYTRDFGWRWFESDVGYISPNLEAGAGFFREEGSSDVYGFEALPLLIYVFKTDFALQPYLEGGAGGVYLTEETIEGNNLGGHLQFADILGLGCRFGRQRQHSLGARYVHYSNADLHSVNDGIDYVLLRYGFSF